MGRSRTNNQMDFKIRQCKDHTQIDWSKNMKSKYIDIYKAVMKLPIGKGMVECVCESKSLASLVRGYVYKHQKGNYQIRARRITEINKWYFMKV